MRQELHRKPSVTSRGASLGLGTGWAAISLVLLLWGCSPDDPTMDLSFDVRVTQSASINTVFTVTWTADGSDLVVGPGGLVAYDEREGLRTVDAVSPSLRTFQVLGSLIGFGGIYLVLGALWLFILDRKIKQGPEPPQEHEPPPGDDMLGAAGRRARHEGRMTDEGDTETETA